MTRAADAEPTELLWQYWANMTADADADADEFLLRGMPWANNETDPVYAPIARRMKAVGATYGNARWWLSWRCPRRERNGTLSRIARRCYVRGLRKLEEEALLRSRPPPQETPEQEARRTVVELLSICTVQVHPWPEMILNPVIKRRFRTDTGSLRPRRKSWRRW